MTAPSLAPALTHRRPAFSLGRWLEQPNVFSWLMVTPPVLFLAALVGYPLFYGIWLSLLLHRYGDDVQSSGSARTRLKLATASLWRRCACR